MLVKGSCPRTLYGRGPPTLPQALTSLSGTVTWAGLALSTLALNTWSNTLHSGCLSEDCIRLPSCLGAERGGVNTAPQRGPGGWVQYGAEERRMVQNGPVGPNGNWSLTQYLYNVEE